MPVTCAVLLIRALALGGQDDVFGWRSDRAISGVVLYLYDYCSE